MDGLTALNRLLFRVEYVHTASGRSLLVCVIPGWNPGISVLVDRSTLPEEWLVSAGTRFFARMNLGAEEPEDLVIDGPFEFAPPLLDLDPDALK